MATYFVLKVAISRFFAASNQYLQNQIFGVKVHNIKGIRRQFEEQDVDFCRRYCHQQNTLFGDGYNIRNCSGENSGIVNNEVVMDDLFKIL